MTRLSIIPFFVLLCVPASAFAGEVALPLGWGWCAERPGVESSLSGAYELTEGVVESEAVVFGVRGSITAVFEADLLIEARFRCFDNDANLKAIESGLAKQHGAGVRKERSKEGLARSFTVDWEVDTEQHVALKVGSESIKVNWQVPASRCVEIQQRREGLSDAEQADLDASSKKPAIAFDPYGETIEDVEARKKATDDAKKGEETKEAEEEEAKAPPPPKDAEIDW